MQLWHGELEVQHHYLFGPALKEPPNFHLVSLYTGPIKDVLLMLVKLYHLYVHRLSFERACIGAATDWFSVKVFKMKQRQQTMLSFLLTAKKSPRQTGNKR